MKNTGYSQLVSLAFGILIVSFLITFVTGDIISSGVQNIKTPDITNSNIISNSFQTPVLPSQGGNIKDTHSRTVFGSAVVYAPHIDVSKTNIMSDRSSAIPSDIGSFLTLNVKSNRTTCENINLVKNHPPPQFSHGIDSQISIASVNPASQSQIAEIANYPYHTDKKIIEYGCDAPAARWVKGNIASMEQKPFDGLVFWPGDNAVSLFLPWDWSKYPDHLDTPNLSTINWNKFKGNNFLLIHTWTCDDWTDYWDDAYWTTVETNMADLAKAAKDSGCAGILLDTEWYSTKSPFSYDDMGLGHTRAETEAKIRQRGAQIMNAWQSQYPDITILTTYLIKPIYWGGDEWGLLPYWMNGMLDVIGPDARLVHSDEDAYYYSDTTTWFSIYDKLKVSKSALTYLSSSNEDKWKKNVEVGKTLYWENVMTPSPTQAMKDRWEHNAYLGLVTSDKWTWVYSDAMNWWGVPKEFQPTGCFLENTGIYPGTVDGLNNARTKYDNQEKLGWDWYGTSVYESGNKDMSVSVEFTGTKPATVSATSSNGAISKVDFYVNMVLVNSDTTSPYTLDTSYLPYGTYTVIAQATDVNGRHGTSAPVAFSHTPDQGVSISSITPNSGYNSGTITVIISGENFGPGALVVLRNDALTIPLNVQQITTSQITCSLPLDGVSSGLYNLIVTNTDGTSAIKDDAFSVTEAIQYPVITSISPVSGYNSGDIKITINGKNFKTGAIIKLTKGFVTKNGVVTKLSENQIEGTFALKGMIAGIYTITITNPDGKSVSKANAFTVLAAGAVPSITRVSPNTGTNLKNLVVYVTGKNFRSNAVVTISQGGIVKNAMNVNLMSSRKLQCTLPLTGVTKGYWTLTVKNIDGTSATKLKAVLVKETATSDNFYNILPI
ncbi:MAG: hypothetical protein GXY48_12540 [Methanomicrobiales archaeon]|nr:hypothetical protein [Methanomicrobiales archaeon]